MIPLVLFLLGCAAVYVGTVDAAFAALMRLPLRLGAERHGRLERLGYLDDPPRLFVPIRLLQGVLIVLVAVIAIMEVGSLSVASLVAVALALIAFVVICEHLLPILIVRHDPGESAGTAVADVSGRGRRVAAGHAAAARSVGWFPSPT